NNSCGLILTDAYHLSSDASLFSTSLPILRREKFSFTEPGPIGASIDGCLHDLNKLCLEEVTDPLEDGELSKLGIFVPCDEDELYVGPEDDLDLILNGLPTRVEDLDDDLFGSGGGIEIESDNQENLANTVLRLCSSNGTSGSTNVRYGCTNAVRTFSGEHPSGEHPSRTLFVRNINSHVDDSELKSLFEQYGDIRKLYTACKQRGFVMISYYDIRDARKAMGSLQNRLLRGRNLDIHFSIPKIRETPHKQNHKFIEFYDVRAAEAALKALNGCDIAGRRIKLEPSRPGGARQRYTSKMLIAAIDETRGVIYDFIYLPIDFKNKCNVGYAFINMVSPLHIITFYKAFNGKKWEKFNSEKVASLAYARIQGLTALVSHFQNSSLMNEDRRCRPIVFKSECPRTGDVEPFPSGHLNILIRQPDGSYTGDSLDSPKGYPDSQ
ncbi:hypothetical protein F511_04652, partial [Dorcoceras hygrometricum]